MSFKNIANFFGLPIASGTIAAIVLLLIFPRLNEPEIRENSLLPSDPLSPSGHWIGPTSYSDAVARAAPSVVNIWTQKKVKNRTHPLFNDPNFKRLYNSSQATTRFQTSLGSGVIVSPEGFILTNLHVIEGAQEIRIQMQDGREAQAQIIGSDYDTDLAVLKVELDNLKPISLGNYMSAKVGDIVLAIGNHSVGRTVTQGIISAKGRRYGLGTGADMIQTDAAINPGNSGGALVDAFGNLLGINRMTLSENQATGISFAIPVDTAITALNDIIEHGSVVRGWLGFSVELIIREQLSPQGLVRFPVLLVTGVAPNGPAELSGLRAGDLITKFNDRPSTDESYVHRLSSKLKPDDNVKIEVIRNNELATLNATASTEPEQP